MKVIPLMRRQAGVTLIELLASLLIISLTITVATKDFLDNMRADMDRKLMLDTDEKTRAIANLISYDLRMVGAGMPIGQSNFPVGSSSLGDAPLAVLTNASPSEISYRLNDLGSHAVLTDEFSPSTTNQIDVSDSSLFETGDTLYISDALVGGNNGYRGQVVSSSGDQVTLGGGQALGGIKLPVGSTVHRVRTVTLRTENIAGQNRLSYSNDVGQSSILSSNALLNLQYLDDTGNPLALPLTEAAVNNQLTSIGVFLQVTAARPLRRGGFYTSELRQEVMIRNLLINR